MLGRSRYSKEELESLFFPCLFHLKAKIVFQGRARVLCGAFEARLGQQQGWGPSLLLAVPHTLPVPNPDKPLEHWGSLGSVLPWLGSGCLCCQWGYRQQQPLSLGSPRTSYLI